MSTDLDALIYRISHLESRINELDDTASETTNTTTATQAQVSGSSQLVILSSPITLSSGIGGLGWSTQAAGSWPSNATHVYLSVSLGNGAGNFEVRENSSATGYAICGSVSANNFSGGTAACAFAKLATGSTFDWRNLANNSYTLTLVGYVVPFS
jgi:hypothetical protein